MVRGQQFAGVEFISGRKNGPLEKVSSKVLKQAEVIKKLKAHGCSREEREKERYTQRR